MSELNGVHTYLSFGVVIDRDSLHYFEDLQDEDGEIWVYTPHVSYDVLGFFRTINNEKVFMFYIECDENKIVESQDDLIYVINDFFTFLIRHVLRNTDIYHIRGNFYLNAIDISNVTCHCCNQQISSDKMARKYISICVRANIPYCFNRDTFDEKKVEQDFEVGQIPELDIEDIPIPSDSNLDM